MLKKYQETEGSLKQNTIIHMKVVQFWFTASSDMSVLKIITTSIFLNVDASADRCKVIMALLAGFGNDIMVLVQKSLYLSNTTQKNYLMEQIYKLFNGIKLFTYLYCVGRIHDLELPAQRFCPQVQRIVKSFSDRFQCLATIEYPIFLSIYYFYK